MAEYDGPDQTRTLPPCSRHLHPLPQSSSPSTSTYRAPSTFYDGPRRTSAPQLHREDGMAHPVNSTARRLTLSELSTAAAAHLHPLASHHDIHAAACPCHPTLADSFCRLHGPALPTQWQWPYLQQGCTSLGQSVEVYEEFLDMGYSPSQQQRYWLDAILAVYFDSLRDDRPGLRPAHAGLRLISGILKLVQMEAHLLVNRTQQDLNQRPIPIRNYLAPLFQPGSNAEEQAPEEVFGSDILDPLEGARFCIGSIIDRASSQVPGAAISSGPHITDAPLTHAEMDRLQALDSTDWIAGMVPYAAFWDWLRTRRSALSLLFLVMTWWSSDEVGKIRLIKRFFPHLVEKLRAAIARMEEASASSGTQRRRRSASPPSRRVAARLGDGVAAHHPAQSQGTALWLDMASAPPPPPPPFSQEPATLIPGPHQVQHVRAHFGTSSSSPHDADQQSQSQHAPPGHQARPQRHRTLTSAGSRLQAVAQGSATPQETISPYTPQAAASPPAHLLPRPHAPAHRYMPPQPPPAWHPEQRVAPSQRITTLSPQAPAFQPQQPASRLPRPAELYHPSPLRLESQPAANQTRGRRGLTISELPPNVTTSSDSMPVAAQPFAFGPPGHEPTMGLGLTFPVHQQGAQPSTFHIAPAPPPPPPPPQQAFQGTTVPLPSTSSGAGNAVASPGLMDAATTLLSFNPPQQQQLAGRPATAPSALPRAGMAEAVTAHRAAVQRGGGNAVASTSVVAADSTRPSHATSPAVSQASPAQQSTLPLPSLPPLPARSSEPWPPSFLAPALFPTPASVPATSTLPPRPSLTATQPFHETHGLPPFAFASGSNRASMPQPPWQVTRVEPWQRVDREDVWQREWRERAAARARADAAHALRVGGTSSPAQHSRQETTASAPNPSGSLAPVTSLQDAEAEESNPLPIAPEDLEWANPQPVRPADQFEAVARARALLGQTAGVDLDDDEGDDAGTSVQASDADSPPRVQILHDRITTSSSEPCITVEAATPPSGSSAPSPQPLVPAYRRRREIWAERRRSLPNFLDLVWYTQYDLLEQVRRERLWRESSASWREEDYHDLSLRMPASFGDDRLYPEVPASPRRRIRTMEVRPRRRGDLPGAPLPHGSPPFVSSDAGDGYPGETASRQRRDAEAREERRFVVGDELYEAHERAKRRREG